MTIERELIMGLTLEDYDKKRLESGTEPHEHDFRDYMDYLVAMHHYRKSLD